MSTRDRHVLLGLASPRAAWFRAVAQWANAASLPADFVKCVSVEELRTRLSSGRPFSALLIDAGVPALDRDLVDAATDAGCAVLVVADGRTVRDWTSLGVAAVLPFNFDRAELVDALAHHARPIGRGDLAQREAAPPPTDDGNGHVAAVIGAGGTGVSTVAIALAQGWADRGGTVLLADLALHAEQAMLHDAGDVVPGIQELVEAHRSGQPADADLRALTFEVSERGYDLLLGLRRSRAWSMLRPRAVDASLESLARAWDLVVCDVDRDLEGEAAGGSIEVEERNSLTRTAVDRADVVVAVGLPTMKGLYSLVRVLEDLIDFGVAPGRILPVLNRAPRNPRQRAALATGLSDLIGATVGGVAIAAPVFVQERRVDDALRDGVRLPDALARPLAAAVATVVDGAPAPAVERLPQLIRPGELGAWTG